MPVFQRIQLNSVLNRRHHLRTPLCSPSLGDTSDVRFVPLPRIATTPDTLCNGINRRALIVAQGRMSPTAPSSLPTTSPTGFPNRTTKPCGRSKNTLMSCLPLANSDEVSQSPKTNCRRTPRFLQTSQMVLCISSIVLAVMRAVRV